MSVLSEQNRNECERIFNYLDKYKDNRLNSNQVILGLAALGKICSFNEQKKIENKSKFYDLDGFIKLCVEKVDFKNMENNLISYIKILENKDKIGYISIKNLSFVLKKFDENITNKEINEIIREVGDEQEGYINIENLLKELLLK